MPMRRYVPNPLHTGVAHGGVGDKAAGDGVLDQDLFAFLEQGDLFFFDCYGLVDFGGFAIQKICDCILLTYWGIWNFNFAYSFCV